MKTIRDVNAAIDALGGTTRTSKLFAVLPSAVSNWRKNGFPPRLHRRIEKELSRRSLAASESLFIIPVRHGRTSGSEDAA